MATAALYYHLLYMGFTVVMSALRVPFFASAVLYRPRFGPASLALAILGLWRLLTQPP